MNLIDIRRFEMLTRCRDFGLEHASVFTPDSAGAKVFGDLNAVVTSLDQRAITQFNQGLPADQGAAPSRASLRQALRDTLERFVLTAQAVAATSGGDLEQAFHMPKAGDQRLLTAAKAFALDAEPLKAGFIAHGMPDTFLDDLNKEIEEFDAALTAHSSAREARAAAKYGIDAALEQGLLNALRLDAVVRNTMRNDGEALAKWTVARHVQYPARTRHPRKPDPAPLAPPAPAASALN